MQTAIAKFLNQNHYVKYKLSCVYLSNLEEI